MKKHLYRTMTHEDVNDAVLEGRVVLIPVAQLETHGPHLPIDVDVVQVQYVVEEAAAQHPMFSSPHRRSTTAFPSM